MNDLDLLLRNVDFVLEQDQNEAVVIFTSRTIGQNVQECMDPQFIVEVSKSFYFYSSQNHDWKRLQHFQSKIKMY